MKERKIITLAVKDLVKGSLYLTHTKNLVIVKNIDEQKKKLHLYNVSEQCNMWIDFNRHIIVERVR
jgi:hypothetical protein